MPALLRSISLRGPKFFRGETSPAEDGKRPASAPVMFVNVLDASTRDGPRVATQEDRKAHPEAYDAFLAGAEGEPLKPLVKASEPRAHAEG